jgi:hypothetical protein
MKVYLRIDDITLEVNYTDHSGTIDHIKDLETGNFVKMSMYMEGVGYTKAKTNSILGFNETVYDARYVSLPDYGNVNIPYHIFIKPEVM